MGTGSDVAIQSAGVTLVKGDLRGIVRARKLSRATMRNIRQNLFLAFVYNAIGVPIAAGVLFPFTGLLLNPMIAEGQIRGAFVQGLATALYEEFLYDEAGSFLTGTFADYIVPTSTELPDLELLHIESPSPFTPLGAKGLAEGNCMSVPACIANAIADALGVKDVRLPATPRRIHALMASNGGVR